MYHFIMQLPFFFTKETASINQLLTLEEDTSKHVSQVLRMHAGEQLQLTDGKGNLFTAQITDAHKKHSTVQIISSQFAERPRNKTTIAISLLKNNSRFEWFLEKATELGIQEIVPLLCDRTERQHFRYDRMNAVLISAMLQSQQCWLPQLHEPIQFDSIVNTATGNAQKFIAHCIDDAHKKHLHEAMNASMDAPGMVLIGPEGDFTKDEIESALQHAFIPVSLGNTRLRTETAGVVAAVLLSRHIGI